MMLLAPLLKYVTAGLGALSLILALGLYMERRHSAKLQSQLAKATAELTRISATRDEQRETTRRSIAKADEGVRSAERRAQRIESAPVTPGRCETPEVIMGADL